MTMPVITEKSAEQRYRAFGRAASEYPGAQHFPLDYPGRRPATSFVYIDRVVLPMQDAPDIGLAVNTGLRKKQSLNEFLVAENSTPLSSRYAVLAIGSNACPGRLQEKFDGKDREPVIVVKGWIAEVDSLYAAWLADYGALPATIASSPGTDVEIWATLLTGSQLAIMNRTENLGDDYVLVSVAAPFRIGTGTITNVYAYFDRRVLVLDGDRIRVADFEARNAKHRALSEREVLAAVLDRLGFCVGESIDRRHRVLIAESSTIKAVNARLTVSHSGRNIPDGVLAPILPRELHSLQWSAR